MNKTLPKKVISEGLRGGAKSNDRLDTLKNELQLINRGTDCFVNSVIQMLRNTDYFQFIRNDVPSLLGQYSGDHCKLSRLLSIIYRDESFGKRVSAEHVRTHISIQSRKAFFDNGSQQDAEEFFRALENILYLELLESPKFEEVRSNHWGKEVLRRKFVDNTSEGKCQNCGNVPYEFETPFLVLKLKNLPKTDVVSLSSLINDYLSESTEVFDMKCSFCCQQQRHSGPCPLTGVCRNKKAVEKLEITRYPKYLFIQLMRNVGNQPKIMTHVTINSCLEFPNDNQYEIVATLDHIGNAQNMGHYVTHLKQESGQWISLDDTYSKNCSFIEANTKSKRFC